MHTITAIPALTDNYIWAIRAPNTPQVAVVDPGDAEPVIEYLEKNKLQLSAILLTHHHMDHIGGVEDLLQYTTVPVYGPSSDLITTVSDPVADGVSIILPAQDLHLKVLAIPAHTLDHIAYYNHDILFCGDTLFTAGCGRIFEGTPAQMLTALQKLAALDPETKVYCGHEYTINNLSFAVEVEPNNDYVKMRLIVAEQLRRLGLPTVPTSMALELITNPFLRTNQPDLIAAVEDHAQQKFTKQVDVFAALRQWKNNF